MACCAVRWRELPLVQVVFGSFWVVSDGFCWLRVILDGFRSFSVLLVTSISQHTEKLTLYRTHGRTWLTQVIRLFYSKYSLIFFIAKYLRQGILAGIIRKIFENRAIIRTHEEKGEKLTKMGRSSASSFNGFNLSQKLFTAAKKCVCKFFLWFSQFILG